MPPIPIKSISVTAKKSTGKPEVGPTTVPGRIQSMTQHHGGKHVELSIVHGRRKNQNTESKGGKNASPLSLGGFDDRPRSHVHIPKSQAKQFRMGQRVGIGITPMEDTEEPGEDAGQEAKEGGV